MLPDGPSSELEQAVKDFAELSNEYADLEELHRVYRIKLQEVHGLQKKCLAAVNHQKYRLNAITKMLKHVPKDEQVQEPSLEEEDPAQSEAKALEHEKKGEKNIGEKACLERDMLKRRAQLEQIETTLPRPSGRYLQVILGAVSVSILDKKAKYDYKDQYERFKVYVNSIGCIIAGLSLYFDYHVLDLLFMFLTVWYYCTLTIRESILKVNGSRIKGWWRTHHFISTFAGGVMLIWPNGACYQSVRYQLMWFNVYVAFLQYLQFTYQRGVLYRLRSLGERQSDMDITIDGFHSWMWKGLGFLLPFLYLGYVFQLYNAYTLFYLSFHAEATWHVSCLCLVFMTVGVGNIITTSWTIPTKIWERRHNMLKVRFTRLDKYFWSHANKRVRRDSQSKSTAAAVQRIMERSNSRLLGSGTAKGAIPEEQNPTDKKNE